MEEDKIIIFNAGGYGDILNTTPIAKHYKIENPNVKITWITRKKYESCIKNNKFIDKIIFTDESLRYNNVDITKYYIELFNEKKINVKFVAPYATNFISREHKPIGRSNLLDIIYYETSNIYDWKCDFIPVVFLSEEEKEEAKNFYNSLKGDKKILLEYETFSSQSPFDKLYFDMLCEELNNKNIDLILTGRNLPPYFNKSYIKYKINFHHYKGSFMSNAELYNLCDAFISSCSGITCLTHSDYCDNSKLRIEVSWGYHWSSVSWKHMKNKYLCFYLEQFKKSLKENF